MPYTGAITNFFIAMRKLGYEQEAIREQVWRLSLKHQTDDQAFVAALGKALSEAQQVVAA